MERGYLVDRAVGQSHFRCDLAIRREGDQNYRLGVIVDTEDYYRQPDILERDLMKPRLLQAFGWRMQTVLAKDCLLVSDGAKAYGALARTLDIGHVGLNTSAGIYVRDGIYHIQNVNSYTSGLKGWMARFKGVATKNLPVYLGWRRLMTGSPETLTTQAYLMAAAA